MIRDILDFIYNLYGNKYLKQTLLWGMSKEESPDLLQLKWMVYYTVKVFFAAFIVFDALCFLQAIFKVFPLECNMIALIYIVVELFILLTIPLIPLLQPNAVVVMGILWEIVAGKKFLSHRVHFVNLVSRPTVSAGCAFHEPEFWRMFPRDYRVDGVSLKYNILLTSMKPKQSKCIKPFRYYDCADHVSLKCKSVNWIMTKQKSDLLDELIRLEPTAEFEIRYLKYSKLLQEIRPIEGWEYAEGVPELCEKISKMYP